jgi:Na+/H+ antiporter NhaC
MNFSKPLFLTSIFLFTILFGNAQYITTEKQDDNSYDVSISPVEIIEIYDFDVDGPVFTVGNIPAKINLVAKKPNGSIDSTVIGYFLFDFNNKQFPVEFKFGKGEIKVELDEDKTISIKPSDTNASKTIKVRHIPFWLSIVPPLIAIIVALLFKEVLSALFLGLFSGTLIMHGFSIKEIMSALLEVLDKYIIHSLTDEGHISVLVFSMMIGGMVAIISKNGGMAGIVEKLSNYAKTKKSAQMTTWFLGIAIFFDDYANTLVVGNTMRPVTDRFKISREKLAYIVDSTAAPVASIAFVTTWIGAELGYIKDAISELNIKEGAYSLFINSLQYSFYPIFTLVFMFFLIYLGKDFGAMFTAEKNAEKGDNATSTTPDKNEQLEALNPVEGIKFNWLNAFIPVIVVIAGTIISLLITGFDSSYGKLMEAKVSLINNEWASIWNKIYLLEGNEELGFFKKLGIVIGNSDSYKALLWSSLCGVFVAILLTLSQKIMSLHQTIETLLTGFKTMFSALMILVLAWSLSAVTKDLHTAEFLTSVFSDSVSPMFMPVITFVLAAAISFATGSSWGTMAILYPLILPATWNLCQQAGMSPEDSMSIFYHVISVVLAGSVFGDHCSPISDTTILSSMASGCNHLSHVKTQLPYALTVGALSIVTSLIFVNILPWYLCYILGFIFLFAIVKYFGKQTA